MLAEASQDVIAHEVRITTFITPVFNWDIEFPYVKGKVRLDRIILQHSPLSAIVRKRITFHGHKIKKDGEPGEVHVERDVYDGVYLADLPLGIRGLIAKGFEEAPTIV